MMRLATYNDKVVMNMITKVGFNRLRPSMGGGEWKPSRSREARVP